MTTSKRIILHLMVLFALPTLWLPWHAEAAGYWTSLANAAPGGVETMLLLSDGTVMAQNGGGTGWYKLTPDATGHFINGTWTNLASMNNTRLYYSSDVLTNGKVFVAGAEYGTGTTNAELYDPVANSWTILPLPVGIVNENNTINTNDNSNREGFIDSGSVVLNNGNVLIMPVRPATNGFDSIYSPANNNWFTTAKEVSESDEDEASMVKLPDDSILLIDSGQETSERYLPASNTWTNDAEVPDSLYDIYGREEGAGFLLPNGKAFFIGSTPNTAIYTPSGNDSPGSWTNGPAIPKNLGAPDAPAAMMVNGKILCALSPSPYVLDGTNQVFTTPTYFYEYDYSAGAVGTFTQVNAPNGSLTNAGATFNGRMLDLPDGTVLFTDGGSKLYVYTPDLSALSAGQPAITSVAWNANGTLSISGTLFNGIGQGAAYGDDAQMDSNYPLIRFRDSSGNVTYGRSYNWSSTSVQTGGRIITTQCAVPANIYDNPGTYSLQVVANGNASAAVTFYGPVWVDFNYGSSSGNGTYSAPYNTLAAGVSAVPSGGTIALKPGTSGETMTVSKPMTIVSVNGSASVGD